MKTITVLSGKGGVGKSSITASLAVLLSKNRKIICADCDVDASNLALVLGIEKKDYKEWEPSSTNQKAIFDLAKCNSCKKCFESCHFDAIDWKDEKPKLKEFSCEGCGVCELICPNTAIVLIDVANAKLGYSKADYGFIVVSAQIEIGGSGSGKVVAEVKKKARDLAGNAEILLVDSAAGIGCPVIASIAGSDYIIGVTEPTPSGFSDMKRALEVVNHFKIPSGIVINKYDINKEFTRKIEDFANKEKIAILQKIPYDKKFVDALVNLKPIVVYDKSKIKIFQNIIGNILLIKEY
jgi:MinD superfamily P-loop ATPase